MDYSLPGYSVHGILQTRILEWVALPCPPPRGLPNTGIKPTSLMSPALAGGFFTTSTTWEAHIHAMNQSLFLHLWHPVFFHLPSSILKRSKELVSWYLLQHCCLGNSTDRGAWQATVRKDLNMTEWVTLSLPLPPSSAFFCTSGLSYPSWPRMPFPPCWHDGDPLGFQFSQTRISTAVLAILLHSCSSHECLVSALVSWALLDSLIGFAHWTMSSVRAGMACPPLNLHHLARCSEHSRSSNHFYGKHQ